MKQKNIESAVKEGYTEHEMALYIRALSDIVFKYIFGTEESTEILRAFINAVLTDAGYPAIKEVSVVNPFNDKTYSGEKLTVIDTRAKDEKGNIYNVEVQIRSQADFQERSLYYWASAYSEQLPVGHEFGRLHRVVSISVVDFKLFADHIPFHSCFMLRENSHPDYVLSEDCAMHYLETPKLKEEPATEVEKWLYLLLHAGKEDERMHILIDQNDYFRQAMDRYTYFIADERARLAYLAQKMAGHDQATYIADARREGWSEGHEEGFEQGREDGIQQGIQEGIRQGEERGEELGAKRKALETAEKLLERGMSPAEAAEITGLSPEDLTAESDS